MAKIAVGPPSNVELSIEDIEMLKICSDTEESEAEYPKCGLILVKHKING